MRLKKIGEKDDRLLLTDEKGRRAYFSFLEMTVLEGREYAALVEENDDAVLLLRFDEHADGAEFYETIDDDSLFDRVRARFAEEFGDELGES